MLGRPGSTDTWTGVGYRLPRLRELPQRMSDHIGHDFDIDEVLAIVDGEPVLCRQGSALVAAFHPELAEDDRIHREFLSRAFAGA